MVYTQLSRIFATAEYSRVNILGDQVVAYFNNADSGLDIFIVVNNIGLRVYGMEELTEQGESLIQYFNRQGIWNIDMMYLICTNDIKRDSYMHESMQCWFLDAESRNLIIYENQPTDFAEMKENIASNAFLEEKRRSKRIFPWITIIIILINVAVYMVMEAKGSTLDTLYMLNHGASYWSYEFNNGEIYRLFTCMFMHFGFAHIFNNMLSLYIIGMQAEQIFGRIRYLVLYIVTGLFASIISSVYYMIIDDNVVSAGASGAIFGIIGAVLVAFWINRKSFDNMRGRLIAFIILIFYNIVGNGGVDNAAHIGGLVSGVILSLIMLKTHKKMREKKLS